MSDALYAVYGASGCGRSIMPLARETLKNNNVDLSQLVFIDDKPEKETINGHKVLTWEQFLEVDAKQCFVALAIANSQIRSKLAAKLAVHNVTPWNITANNAVHMDNVDVGEGALISPFVTLTSNIKIGCYFHANLYSYVEHDCVIGNFVTFAPRVSCNGNVHIGDHAYIGTGAIIRQGTPDKPLVIGEGAVVGMGAVVTKDVPAGATVVGNPARPLVKS